MNMAGDWIKMRTDLYRDPKVCVITDALLSRNGDVTRYVTGDVTRVTRCLVRNAVVGALVSVWGVARQRGRRQDDDLILSGCALAVLDDIADMPGFGEAMQAVGWVFHTADGVVLPGFFNEYNEDPKSKSATRQKQYRDRKKAERYVTGDVTRYVTRDADGDVTRDDLLRPREEKRREEKSKDTEEENTPPPAGGGAPAKTKPAAKPPAPSPESVPIPPALDTAEFREAWGQWLGERRDKSGRRIKLSALAAKTQLERLTPLGPTQAIACIRESIANSWQGLFPDKFTAAPASSSKTPFPTKGEAMDAYAAKLFASIITQPAKQPAALPAPDTIEVPT
jgi:hypothetical protein